MSASDSATSTGATGTDTAALPTTGDAGAHPDTYEIATGGRLARKTSVNREAEIRTSSA